MNNNDDVANNSTDYLKRKVNREVRNKSYQVVHGSIDNLKEKRKVRVHRKHIDNIQKFDDEININKQNNNYSSNLDNKIEKNEYKINEVNTDRNKFLDKREDILNKNPNLDSSLNYLDRKDNNYYSNQSTKQYKTERQKKHNQSQMKTNIKKQNNNYGFSNNEKNYYTTKERDLDNDGVPDRIDIDDTRNSVQTTADLHKVGNKTDKNYETNQSSKEYRTERQKKHNQKELRAKSDLNINSKEYKNISLKKEKNKFQIGNKEEFYSLINKEDKIIVKKTNQKTINHKKMKKKFTFEDDVRKKEKKSMFGSPLTSKAIGHRTKTQKVILAPTKAISGVGAGLKESLNKEIENSDMEGIRLANDIVSPLARKLKFEGNSLVAKKVGFDRKAFNLSKVEKKIIKSDKKAFKIKKAQRKNIRKKAKLNAKTVKGSKLDLVGRVKSLTAKSANQIKMKIINTFKDMVNMIKGTKFLATTSGLLLLAVIPFLVLAPLILLVGGSALTSADEQEVNLDFSASALSADVMQWEDKVIKELKKYGLEDYKDLVLVIIHLESKGTLPDVMQSSESAGLPPNSITDPNESIEAGVKHLSEAISMMKKHKVDVQTLIQSYNYGTGFIPYLAKNGGKWTQKLANDYSAQEAKKLGWSSYGDKTYVSKALEHLTISGDSITIDVSFDLEGGKLAFPVPNYETAMSSSYGWRIHPISGERKFHTGTDIPAPTGTPVIAVADGVVTRASNMGGYGQAVMIDHGSGVVTLYGHNSALKVTAGQKVKGGTVIALVGSTGQSTGPHSHFEVRKNGEYTDPVKWLK